MQITDKIKIFEDACAHLGISTALPGCDSIKQSHAPSVQAYYMLAVITEALNEDWELDWNDRDQPKWINRTYKDPAGVNRMASFSTASVSSAFFPSRLCFRSKELADYAHEQFAPLYRICLIS